MTRDSTSLFLEDFINRILYRVILNNCADS